jgi:hypothetical protein
MASGYYCHGIHYYNMFYLTGYSKDSKSLSTIGLKVLVW